MALHGQCPGFRGGKGAGRTGELGVKGVVFGEFAGEEPVGEPGLFRRAARGQEIGGALTSVGGLLFDDLDEARAVAARRSALSRPRLTPNASAVARCDASGAASSWRRSRKSRSSSGMEMTSATSDPVGSSLFTDEQMSQSRIRQKVCSLVNRFFPMRARCVARTAGAMCGSVERHQFVPGGLALEHDDLGHARDGPHRCG
jgi:hypothetical protein